VTTATLATAVDLAAAEPGRFGQDRFAISFWYDPPADKDMAAHYAEIARANFTVVLGTWGARTPEAVGRQLELCRKYDLKAIVARAGLAPDKLPADPACWGYMVKDEPNVKDFPALKAQVEAIRKARPGKLAFINLYPNTAGPDHWGADTYENYVDRFIREVDVDVLSMDYYPHMRPERDTRDRYCENLAIMRRVSLERGIPFWNFFNTMPFGSHYDPTEAQLRWQIFTSLAYGAKGVMYFCYWTPKGKEFPKGGAIITTDGRPTRHYDQAARINAAVKNLGAVLMKLTSTAVLRIQPNDDPATVLKGSPIRTLTPGDYLIGVFKHADGRRAVLLNNYRHDYTAWPTVEFDTETSQVMEVSQKDGQIAPVIDDSPAMEGLQISLDAGEGRLFLLPAK
jgi:hypothetical protein